jgi:MFS family permease
MPSSAALMTALAALRHRNFRLMWLGLLVSFAGGQMQFAALLWHVSLLAPEGKKGLALGLTGLVRFLPLAIFSTIGGVVADASDRRRLLFVTQILSMLAAATLALLTFRGLDELWPLYALSAVNAGSAAFDAPARQALMPNLVPREDLGSAISLNVLMFHAAAVIGPAAGGIVIAQLGVAWAYAINAASFLAVIVSLLLLRGLDTRPQGGAGSLSLEAMREGWRWVFSQPLIRSTMLLDFAATFFGSATALLPLFTQDVLHAGAREYGMLSAATGIGSLVAGLAMVPLQRHVRRQGLVVLWSVSAYGAATIAFGLSRALWLAILFLGLAGAADTVSAVLRNIIRQTHVPDRLRGRMTSVNMLFFIGGPQLGEVEAGAVANLWGAPFSIVSGGVACLLAAAGTAWRTPELRRQRHDAT